MSKAMTRSEWERRRPHNEPFPPWRLATWGERAQKALVGLLLCVVFIVMLFGALFVVGRMIDVADERSEQHDRCMKQATNGYEIERCR